MIAREHKREKLIKKFSAARNNLRSLITNINSSDEEVRTASQKIQQLSRNTSRIRNVRRCQLCGRPKGVYRRFGLCRIHLREAAMRGDVPGLVKASW